MNLTKIAVTSLSFSKNNILRSELLSLFPNAKFNETGKILTGAGLIEFLDGYAGSIVGLETIDIDLIDSCQNLKFISKYGVGLDNLDLDYCKQKNIEIGWTGGVNKLSVAEMALGFMLSLSRNLYQSSLYLKDGAWFKNGGSQLSGKTIGIIGVGFIGKELIRLLAPFNCKILVNDIIDQDKYYELNNLIKSEKEEIYSQSDIITIHTPLTDFTRNLINKESISKMKKSVIIINSARGGIVEQNDLKFALETGQIAGAALDVYEIEPPIDNDLLKINNLFCTPHIGGNSAEAVLAMGRSAINHLKNYFF